MISGDKCCSCDSLVIYKHKDTKSSWNSSHAICLCPQWSLFADPHCTPDTIILVLTWKIIWSLWGWRDLLTTGVGHCHLRLLLFKLYFDTNLMKYIVSENYNLSSYWLFTWVKAVHFSITEVWISYWTVNINIKTGDNQFNCQLCGKTFSQNDT